MPGAAPASRIHPLCYEHHCEMKLRESSSSEDGADYACDEPDCLVHYSRSDGYFLKHARPIADQKMPDSSPSILLDRPLSHVLARSAAQSAQLSPLEMPEVQHEPQRWHSDLTFPALNLLSDSHSFQTK